MYANRITTSMVHLTRHMHKRKCILQELRRPPPRPTPYPGQSFICFRQLASTPGQYGSTAAQKNADLPVEQQNYTTFYRFPQIRLARLISRMKLYQTGLTVVGLPSVAAAQSMGYVHDVSLATSSGVALFAGIMLYVMSGYFRRLIGAMGINDNYSVVRVSHLTFWGQRNDVFVPVDKIVPLSEQPDEPRDVYIKLYQYDSQDYLYYSIKYGQIVDKNIFEFALGRLK